MAVNILIILLSACQSMNYISVSKGNTVNSTTGRILGLYTKGSLKDYIGDLDKQNITIATQKAADTDQPQVFTNTDSGVQGKAEVVKTKILSTQEKGREDGVRECKTIRQTIVLKDKREIIESVTACKGPDGWS
jgi:hypothetical protein